jgi:sulfoxide reductase heme-binding subunit YedZ
VTRPYLTLGFISWLILLALAATSTQVRRKTGSPLANFAQLCLSVAILAPFTICGR